MNSREVITELQSLASEKYKANVVRMGIPEEYCIGVSTGEVRNIAKKTGKSNALAFELWNTGYHEVRLLAVLVFDKKGIVHSDIENLMGEVISWDLCDHLCKNLIVKMKDYEEFIYKWIISTHIYKKRAAYTLIATSAIHNKKLSNDTLDDYLKLIRDDSDIAHEHVKKAVSWALREIGKRDFDYNEKALLVAHELLDSGNKTQIWIAKDAIKELESLVKVEGRTRLISTKTQMGNTN
ncbi:MAG: DNA alkylation repair protein [Lachnospiraceae bacterium]|nr:DNA alkylation repair protein [Lachnospiraceae bacterium]